MLQKSLIQGSYKGVLKSKKKIAQDGFIFIIKVLQMMKKLFA